MEKETLKKIFEFLETKDKRKVPLLWKFSNGEPLTEDDLYIKGDWNLSDSNIETLDLDILENLNELKKIILINIKVNKFNCTNKIKIENLIINQCQQIDINLISNIKSLRELYYINNNLNEICDLSDLENLTILDLHNNCIE